MHDARLYDEAVFEVALQERYILGANGDKRRVGGLTEIMILEGKLGTIATKKIY